VEQVLAAVSLALQRDKRLATPVANRGNGAAPNGSASKFTSSPSSSRFGSTPSRASLASPQQSRQSGNGNSSRLSPTATPKLNKGSAPTTHIPTARGSSVVLTKDTLNLFGGDDDDDDDDDVPTSRARLPIASSKLNSTTAAPRRPATTSRNDNEPSVKKDPRSSPSSSSSSSTPSRGVKRERDNDDIGHHTPSTTRARLSNGHHLLTPSQPTSSVPSYHDRATRGEIATTYNSDIAPVCSLPYFTRVQFLSTCASTIFMLCGDDIGIGSKRG
jgi:hypothetical protein